MFFIKTLLRIVTVFFGSFIVALGIVFFIKAGHGVDPISVLLQGLENFTPLKFGTLSQLFNAIILLLVFVLDRSKIGWGSLINALSVGFFINVLIELPILAFEEIEGLGTYLLSLAGILLMGMGLGIYLSADFGVGALEGLMIYFSDTYKITIKYIRMVLDATLVLSGFILGGSVGIGTIGGVLLIGPTIEITLRVIAYLAKQRRVY